MYLIIITIVISQNRRSVNHSFVKTILLEIPFLKVQIQVQGQGYIGWRQGLGPKKRL